MHATTEHVPVGVAACDCLTPFGIGVVAGTDVVVYATMLGSGRDSIFAFLAK